MLASSLARIIIGDIRGSNVRGAFMATVIRGMQWLGMGMGLLLTLKWLGFGLVITLKGWPIWVEGVLAVILLVAWVTAIETEVLVCVVLVFFYQETGLIGAVLAVVLLCVPTQMSS